MSEKLQNIPAWAIIVAVIMILGLAGGFIYKSAQTGSTDSNAKEGPMTEDTQKKYQEQMMKSTGMMQNAGGAPGRAPGPPGGMMGAPGGMAGGAPPAGAPGR